MPSDRAERVARNEVVFREANERMAGWEEQHSKSATEVYFCECADPECRDRVELTKGDYERVRSNPRHFVVVPGHELLDVETVIEQNPGWALIEKPGEVAHIVEDSDPRRDG
jgi:hypothetical protein